MIKKIEEKLNLSPSFYNDYYKEAAILIPLVYRAGALHLLFEVRSSKLNTQPSEICFPGGRIEAFETPERASIRETSEELNIPFDAIRIINCIDTLYTPFNQKIYPFVGELVDIDLDDITPNIDEVDEIFTVPLDYLLAQEVQSYTITSHFDIPENFPFDMIQNGKDYNWRTGTYEVLFYRYKDYVIWGITAKMLRTFLNIVSD